ncbi:MAG: oxidoreductase [Proteobacteria bacterium]|nr:oxidoreductase [Pseudomonadota bacterium]
MAAETLRFKVQASSAETQAVRSIVLAPEGGSAPAWEAGAHVRVALPGGGSRPYSLMALPGLPEGHYALGVLREEASTGGSRFMHSLKAGDVVGLSPPANNFKLHDDGLPAVLFAGGIGVTPILSMAVELERRGMPYRLHYAGRMEASLAFVAQLRAICADRLSLHYDNDASRLDIAAALNAAPRDAHVYVCGPKGMIEAVKAEAIRRGFGADRLHYELFTAEPSTDANRAFEVELRSSGQVIEVAPDQTIIQALEQAGIEVLYDCQRGDCGICQCAVIEGIPDHRDVILSDDEKASNKVMQICVSRAKSARIVLDL